MNDCRRLPRLLGPNAARLGFLTAHRNTRIWAFHEPEEFSKRPAAIAFSGGVDSSYLIYAAKMHGCDVKAYFIKSAFQPQFELDDAMKFAYMHSIPMRIEHVDVLQSGDIVENPADRCFHCKKAVFTKLIEAAREDGYTIICDGTNASDDATERAGIVP